MSLTKSEVIRFGDFFPVRGEEAKTNPTPPHFGIHNKSVLHLVVPTAEEVVPEALCDCGSDSEDLGDVLSSDQHVSVVQLDVHVRLLVQ